MTEFSNFGEGLDPARMVGEHMTSNAKAATEHMLSCGQEIQSKVVEQAAGARDRLMTCLEDLVHAPDAGTATQISASYMVGSLKAYGDNMAHWAQFFQQNFHRSFDSLCQSSAPGV
jgi:hypothetical protein